MASYIRSPAPTGYAIRLATVSDVPRLGVVEVSGGKLFQTVSLSVIADDEPMTPGRLSAMCEEGNVTVAVLISTDEPVAFLATRVIETSGPKSNYATGKAEMQAATYLHIAELSTHGEHQRKGLGSALLQSAIAASRERRLTGLSLTTYRDVSFNGPFYQRFGFREVDPQSVGAEFEELVVEELNTIYAPSRRCFMLKRL